MARTLFTNTSGDAQFFGFLPPHGRQLAAGASVLLDGDLRTVLAAGRGRYTRSRELAGLTNAEEYGLAVATPVAEPLPSSSSSSSSSSSP